MAENPGATNENLTQTASAWLVALDAGTAGTAAFEEWRRNPAHAVAFAEVARTWSNLDGLRSLRTHDKPVQQQRLTRRRVIGSAMAASIVVAAGAIGWPVVDEASAQTGVGERRIVRMTSGALVELNTRTRVHWSRYVDTYSLWLDDGEVAINVPPGRALTVFADRAFLLSPGAYNLRRMGDAIDVAAITGTVRVADRFLDTGTAMRIAGSVAHIQPLANADRDRMAGWRRGEIVFSGETLADAVAEYNRYLDRPLVVADPTLARLRLGGRFASSDPQPFLTALGTGFDIVANAGGSGPIMLHRAHKIKATG